MKRIFLVLMAMLALLVTVGCGSNSDQAKPNVLRYALEAEPQSIDPAMSTNIPSSTVELQLFDGLTRVDAKGEVQPADAEKWTVSEDGLVYTFTLREGLQWSNGKSLTAHDYEYAWKRVLNPETGSPNAYMLYFIKNGEEYYNKEASADSVGVKALDDRTLQVTLKSPTAFFLSLTAFHAYYPVPKDVVEKNPKTWASEASTFVGNGPFVLKEWKHKSEMVFAKNEKYWDAAKVKLEGMVWPISESQTTRVALVENNQVDMMVEPPAVDQDRLAKTGQFKVSPILGVYYYKFNVEAEPVKDARVRKALSMVIDRDVLAKNVIKGNKEPAYAFVSTGMVDPVSGKDFRAEGGNLVNHNVEEARALLKEAGYDKDHPLPKVQILYNTNELHKAVAEAIQQTWAKELGVEAELVNQETKVFFSTVSEGNFMVAKASWIADYSDPQTFLDVFYDPDNDARWHNEEYNALMKEVHSTNDQAVRMAKMHQAEQLLLDEGVVIPIYFSTQPYVANNRIADYIVSSLGTIDFKEARTI